MLALSEKKKASNAKWDQKNLKRISVAFTNTEYTALKNHVEKNNLKINGFIRKAVSEKIEKETESD